MHFQQGKKRYKMNNNKLIYFGFLAPIIFWTTTIVSGIIMGNYNHATRLVSELGAIGSNTQHIFTVGLVLCSIFSVFFIVGLYRTAKENGLSTLPILLIFNFSFSICGAALFPMPLKLHGILGMPAIFLILSPLSALMLWKSENALSMKKLITMSLVLMMLGFLVYTPNILVGFFGIKQRFFHLGWSVWFVTLGVTFIEFNKKLKPL